MSHKLILGLLLLMSPTINTPTKWLISESSSLSVKGSTNVNKFTCDIPNCDQDTLTIWKSDKEIKISGSISPDVLSFDCHKAMMTRDLRKTLKAKKYPKLHIRFLSLNELPQLSGKPVTINGKVEIEIAGIKKFYQVDYRISVDTGKVIHLLGSKDLNFSDFKLIPPRKLGGMIKTKDQLTVAFNLNMKNI
jgi:hypothetical protein